MNNVSEIKRQDNFEQAIPLSSYVKHYLQYLEYIGYSTETINGHRLSLKRFTHWCLERNIETPNGITKPVIEAYQRALFYFRKQNGKPLAKDTQNKTLIIIRTFMKWLVRENHLPFNPADQIELARIPRRLPRRHLSRSEIGSLFDVPDITTPLGIRDRAILETFYSTGMRRNELAYLREGDVDFNEGIIYIQHGSKGGHQRIVPIGDHALAWVEKYYLEVRPMFVAGEDEGVLFLYDNGEAFVKSRLSALVKRLMVKAKIDKEGSCHLLRHSCASHLLESGMDIRLIQQLLGHSKTDTTSIYAKVSIGHLKKIHQELQL
ncbi:MAG: tyrosine-type recombinase/integrase [Agarilytica sp.]